MWGDPPPPTRVCNVPPYERAGSFSAGPGLLSFPPIAVEMYHVVFKMRLRIPRRPWGVFAEGGVGRVGNSNPISLSKRKKTANTTTFLVPARGPRFFLAKNGLVVVMNKRLHTQRKKEKNISRFQFSIF